MSGLGQRYFHIPTGQPVWYDGTTLVNITGSNILATPPVVTPYYEGGTTKHPFDLNNWIPINDVTYEIIDSKLVIGSIADNQDGQMNSKYTGIVQSAHYEGVLDSATSNGVNAVFLLLVDNSVNLDNQIRVSCFPDWLGSGSKYSLTVKRNDISDALGSFVFPEGNNLKFSADCIVRDTEVELNFTLLDENDIVLIDKTFISAGAFPTMDLIPRIGHSFAAGKIRYSHIRVNGEGFPYTN